MQIICPGCQTKFVTNAKEISEQGRRVRCSRCQYIWWHHMQANEIMADTLPELPQFSSKKRWPKWKYLYALLFLIIALAGVISLQQYQNPEGNTAPSITPSIKLENVETQYNSETTVVNWSVHNQTAHPQSLPSLAVELLDAQANVLKRHEVDEKLTIEPGKSLSLKVTFFNKGYEVDKVAIYVDSKLEYLTH